MIAALLLCSMPSPTRLSASARSLTSGSAWCISLGRGRGACGCCRFVSVQRQGAERRCRVAFAIAVILLTIVVPVVFGGPLVAMVWAAEALGLVWLANRYRNADGFLAAAIVYGSLLALFSVEYGASRSNRAPPGQSIPFVNEAGLTLLALLAAGRGRSHRARATGTVTFAVIGFGLLIAALPFQLRLAWLLAGWSLLAVPRSPLNASSPSPP